MSVVMNTGKLVKERATRLLQALRSLQKPPSLKKWGWEVMDEKKMGGEMRGTVVLIANVA